MIGFRIMTLEMNLPQKILGIYDNMGGSGIALKYAKHEIMDLKGLLANMFGWYEIHW